MPILMFLLGPIGRYLMLAVAVGGGILYFMYHERNIGASNIEKTIEQQDHDANEKANDARIKRAACTNAGGVWDITSGECKR